MTRKAAGLSWLGFHDLRHYFCSMCVMAGIDFMTIASWLGHKDGGILVAKVYGHLLRQIYTCRSASAFCGILRYKNARHISQFKYPFDGAA
jgi:site-specific recombinase XerD